MKRKSNKTPKSIISSALRRIWMYSRERQAVLKRDNYTCQNCGRTKKEIKLHVHHLDGSGIPELIEYVYRRLLPDTKRLLTLCEKCHKETTKRERSEE